MAIKGKNSTFLRAVNKKTVLDIIRRNRVSRAEIARITGLTRPAVSSIVEYLIKTGFIMETGVEEIIRGRHPEILSLRPDYYYAIGVDLSRDKCVLGLMDLTGAILEQRIIDIDDLVPVMTVAVIADTIKKVMTERQIPVNQILGVGISLPGPIDTQSGTIINPPNFEKWHYFNILQQFEKEIDLPIFVENHATASALAERLFGQGSRFNNYFMLVLGDGVGSAEILNGKPYRGLRGLTSEFGHVSIDMDGELCKCGNHGCLELYTSIPLVLEKVKAKGMNVNSWKDIIDNALTGNQQSLDVVKQEAKYLSFAITNVINIFIPEAVILSGRVQYKPDLLLSMIKNEIYSREFTKNISMPEIIMSKLNDNTEIMAAASVVLNNIFSASETD